MSDEFNSLVTAIYDCAASPELWPDALEKIRVSLGAAFGIMGYADFSEFALTGNVRAVYRHTPWDSNSIRQMIELMNAVPQGKAAFASGVDMAFSQMTLVTEEEFKKSDMYRLWAKPNRLGDSIGGFYLAREGMKGMFSAPSPDTRPIYNAQDIAFVSRLMPHFRRAVIINDIVDKGRLELELHRAVLDRLSTPVFVVSQGNTVKFANAQAEELLKSGDMIKMSKSRLTTAVLNGAARAFDDAIARALSGDSAIETAGIGVPLYSLSGIQAAAYILPLGGKSLRGELANGCAAIFVAARPEQQPVVAEILRTLYGLTPMEVRVALGSAAGQTTEQLAQSLGSSADTVRTHLKHIYAKAGVQDRTELVAIVRDLMPPIMAKQPQ